VQVVLKPWVGEDLEKEVEVLPAGTLRTLGSGHILDTVVAVEVVLPDLGCLRDAGGPSGAHLVLVDDIALRSCNPPDNAVGVEGSRTLVEEAHTGLDNHADLLEEEVAEHTHLAEQEDTMGSQKLLVEH